MVLYNVNLGIGWSSSGVEYAQKYRNKLLKQIDQPTFWVFTDLILNENICHLTRNLGFADEEVLWPYLFFTDVPLQPTSYTIQQVIDELGYSLEDRLDDSDRQVRLIYDQGRQFARCYLTEAGSDRVDRVEYVCNHQLVRKEYFNETCFLVEYFVVEDQSARVVLRRFLNRDGSTAYEQYVDGDRVIFRMSDRILYSNDEFHAYFFEKLAVTAQDIVLIDRATGTGQGVFQYCRPASIGVVVHAEHYSVEYTNQDYILWNNYYDYQFTHHDLIDFYVVSTEMQAEILAQQFRQYAQTEPKIVVIPVGSVADLHQPDQVRPPGSIMTASRLAAEKHIDWLVEAVALAHEELPYLQFDIYGEGGKKTDLQTQIDRLEAQEYIHLKGHHDMTNIYQNYELYLAASTSEGFGLTLLEAVASGLAMIGLDVPYGNPTFIEADVNGYLLAYEQKMKRDELVELFRTAIIRYYTQANREAMSQASYRIASQYLDEVVARQWQQLIEEVTDV